MTTAIPAPSADDIDTKAAIHAIKILRESSYTIAEICDAVKRLADGAARGEPILVEQPKPKVVTCVYCRQELQPGDMPDRCLNGTLCTQRLGRYVRDADRRPEIQREAQRSTEPEGAGNSQTDPVGHIWQAVARAMRGGTLVSVTIRLKTGDSYTISHVVES